MQKNKIFLYDYDGYQVDQFWQDIFFARRKTMNDRIGRSLSGEGPIIMEGMEPLDP